MEKTNLKSKLLPLILTVAVILVDQISKALICHYLPIAEGSFWNLGDYNGAFLEIIHVRNTGVAFSFGASWPDLLRRIAFSIVPIAVLVLVLVVYFRNKDFTKVQCWAIAGIVGGGFGNIIDRVFRPAGVVDFIDVKWFGLEKSKISLLSMQRWPTFNIADSAVVVCGIMLIISFIVVMVRDSKNKTTEDKAE